jgi:hypothetical protein
MSLAPITRLVPGAPGFNTLNIRTVDIFLQKSPGKPSGNVRGINLLSFQVVKDGGVIQSGTTGPDGRIRMRIQGGVSTLQLLGSAPAAEYEVSIRDDAIEPAATPAGQQRRLRMLGYHIGHADPEGNGVDGAAVPLPEVDRSILEFQADIAAINVAGNANAISSIVDNNTQNALATAAGA